MIRLAEIFQNGMTLQREKPIRIWGDTDRAQTISVYINDKILCTESVSSGAFQLVLPGQRETENAKFAVMGNQDQVILENVDIGEVWIAGGQSNMEFCLNCDRDGEDVIAKADDCHLRYYDVGEYAYEGEREEGLKDGSHWDRWMSFNTEDSGWFSAVAVWFALKLRKELNVPVAIVGCNWGGTSASAWIDEVSLREDDQLKVYTDSYDAEVAKHSMKKYLRWDQRMRRAQFGKQMEAGGDPAIKNECNHPTTFREKVMMKLVWAMMMTGPHDANRPGGLYREMLPEAAGYGCRGVIWYQGESDEHHADLYARLFSKMIAKWRDEWHEELPFLYVQVAPWEEWLCMNGRNFPVLRQQQQIVEDTVPSVWMTSIMDCGSRYDIHPKNKRPVGERLSLLALDKIYNIPQKYAQPPRMSHISRSGHTLDVAFDYAPDGLVADDSVAGLFDLTQNGRKLPCTAKTNGSHITLTCQDLNEGEASLSFAYRDFLVMTLKNKGGLTARPFEPQTV